MPISFEVRKDGLYRDKLALSAHFMLRSAAACVVIVHAHDRRVVSHLTLCNDLKTSNYSFGPISAQKFHSYLILACQY